MKRLTHKKLFLIFAVAILLLACTPFGLIIGCALIVNLKPSDEAFLSRSSYGHLGPEWHQDQHAARGPDDPRFVGLATQRAASSEPTLVGRYVGDDLSDSEILDYLLTNCVIDANMHIEADIYLASETRVGDEHQFLLVAKTVYYSSKRFTRTYDFAVSVASNGDIHVFPAARYGNPLLSVQGQITE